MDRGFCTDENNKVQRRLGDKRGGGVITVCYEPA